MKVVSVQEKYN